MRTLGEVGIIVVALGLLFLVFLPARYYGSVYYSGGYDPNGTYHQPQTAQTFLQADPNSFFLIPGVLLVIIGAGLMAIDILHHGKKLNEAQDL